MDVAPSTHSHSGSPSLCLRSLIHKSNLGPVKCGGVCSKEGRYHHLCVQTPVAEIAVSQVNCELARSETNWVEVRLELFTPTKRKQPGLRSEDLHMFGLLGIKRCQNAGRTLCTFPTQTAASASCSILYATLCAQPRFASSAYY